MEIQVLHIHPGTFYLRYLPTVAQVMVTEEAFHYMCPCQPDDSRMMPFPAP